MKIETFPFPQLLYLLVRYPRSESPEAAGFPAKWKQRKKRGHFIFKVLMQQVAICQHNLPPLKEFIDLQHQQTALLMFLDYTRCCTLHFPVMPRELAHVILQEQVASNLESQAHWPLSEFLS